MKVQGSKSIYLYFFCRAVPKFIKRHQKSIDHNLYKNKNVFGVPIKLNFQRYSQPLPQPIIHMMKYLRRNSMNTIGIFRKSGSKNRMSLLRDVIEKFGTGSYAEFEKNLPCLIIFIFSVYICLLCISVLYK